MRKIEGGYRCPQCKRVLSLGMFGYHAGYNKLNKRAWCRACERRYSAKFYSSPGAGYRSNKTFAPPHLGDAQALLRKNALARRKVQDLREAKCQDYAELGEVEA